MNRRHRDGETGYTLVAVLWALAVIGALALLALSGAREKTQIATNIAEAERARALALAGIAYARQALTGPTIAESWPNDGRLPDLDLDSGGISVTLGDETGRIDLNTADPRLLEGLFAAAGVDPGDAAALAERISDFRDTDDTPGPGGYEAQNALLAGAGGPPKNAPFDHVRELRTVPGITEALYMRIAPALTVQSGARGIDPAFAPPLALQALPGVEAKLVDQTSVMKADGFPAEEIRQIYTSRPDLEELLTVSARRYVRVSATGTTHAGTKRSIDAVIDVRRRSGALSPIVVWDDKLFDIKD